MSRFKKISTLLFLLLGFASCKNALSQDTLPKKFEDRYFTLHLGLGIGNLTFIPFIPNIGTSYIDEGKFSVILNYNYVYQKSFFAIYLDSHAWDKPYTHTHQVALLLGKSLIDKKFKVEGNVGLSFLGGIRKGEYLYTEHGIDVHRQIKYLAIGIPIEMKIYSKRRTKRGPEMTFRRFSWGLWADLNPQKIIYGLTFRRHFRITY